MTAPPHRARRVLMTADAVGGVWTYAMELARGLTRSDFEVVLAVLGPSPRDEQLSGAAEIGLTLVHGGYALEWMPGADHDLDDAGAWLLDLQDRFSPDLVHLNGFAHAALPWQVPVPHRLARFTSSSSRKPRAHTASRSSTVVPEQGQPHHGRAIPPGWFARRHVQR